MIYPHFDLMTCLFEVVEVEGVPIRVVIAAKLYEMKRNTVRLKDKADSIALQEKFHFEEP